MAGIFQTIKWLREGKKVRREGWKEGSYWVLGDDERINWKFEAAKVSIRQIEATDWELFEEKKTLSDEIFRDEDDDFIINDVICVSSIRRAVRELKKRNKEMHQITGVTFETAINDIFGTKLTEETKW